MKKALNYKLTQNGSVLIAAVVFMLILTIPVAPFLSMVVLERKSTLRSYQAIAANSLAEAGVEDALWEFNYDDGDFLSSEGWDGTPKTKTRTLETAGNETIGDYEVVVTDPSGTNPVVESTGYVPDITSPIVQRTVQVVLKKKSLFDNAIFCPGDPTDSKPAIKLDGDASIDGYDSSEGDYGGSNVTSTEISTNSTSESPPAIELLSNSAINGDVMIGPGGDPDDAIADNGGISGGKAASGGDSPVPSIDPPTGLPDEGNIDLAGTDTLTISASGEYSYITLDGDAQVIVTADVTLYVSGQLNFIGDGQLIIAAGAKLTMYVDGSIFFDSNSQINNISKNPLNMTIYGTDSLTGSDPDISIMSNALYYGTICAPKANVLVDSNGEIFGAVIAQTVDLRSNVKIHYDEALQGEDAPLFFPESMPGGYVVRSWNSK